MDTQHNVSKVTRQLRKQGFQVPKEPVKEEHPAVCLADEEDFTEPSCLVGIAQADGNCPLTAVAHRLPTTTRVEITSDFDCRDEMEAPLKELPGIRAANFDSLLTDTTRLLPYFDYGIGNSRQDSGADHRVDFGVSFAFSPIQWGESLVSGRLGWRHNLWIGAGFELSASSPGDVFRPKLVVAYSHRRMASWTADVVGRDDTPLLTAPAFVYEFSVSSPVFLEDGIELTFTAPLEFTSLVARISWGINEDPGVAWTIGLRLPLILGGPVGFGGLSGLGQFGSLFKGLFGGP